ncbi:hypothetical protein J6590_059106 [Homalodisca vitripennis]|nr:hypothetical protein J6590_059106 [Homalodisca vitripennis]
MKRLGRSNLSRWFLPELKDLVALKKSLYSRSIFKKEEITLNLQDYVAFVAFTQNVSLSPLPASKTISIEINALWNTTSKLFRPASAKVFESLLLRRLVFEARSVISSDQHGFIKGRSTFSNVIALHEDVLAYSEMGCQVDCVCLDIAKASEDKSRYSSI